MHLNKHIFLTIVLLSLLQAFAQTNFQKKMDSLETALYSMDKADTVHILEAGSYILKNSVSENQKYTVLQKIAETYFRANNINKSIEYAFKAKEVAEKNAEPERMAQAYGSLANLYSYLNLTEKARLYLDKAMQQIEKLPKGNKMFQLKALSYLELGNLDFNNKEYTGANRNYRHSLEQFSLIKDPRERNTYNYRRSLYNIGNSYYYLNQPDSAESYLEKALKIKDAENPNLKYFIYSTLSEVYSLRSEHRRAIKTLQKILNDPGFDITSLKMEVYLNLSKNYQKIGDQTSYAFYNEKHLLLRDTIQGNTLKAIGTAFKVEQKDFSDSISAFRSYNTWLVLGLIALIVTSGSAIFYLTRNRKRQHLKYLSLSEKLKTHTPVSAKTDTEPEQESKTIYLVPASAEEDILIGLHKFESEEGFRNPKINISLLALSLKTNHTYLSAVIKTHKGKHFNNYINELRIDHICRKIHADPKYANYKISYLAEDCGFISHSTFSTIFKKVTGISPSVFLSKEAEYHKSLTNK